MTAKRKYYKKKRTWIFLILLILVGSTVYYHTHKSLPRGISYEGKVHHVEDVRFLYDLSYEGEDGKEKHEQRIFQAILDAIGQADEFIVLDMFLFNPYKNSDMDFPNISGEITKKLINQKKLHPNLKVTFITDEINLTYGSHKSKYLQELRDHNVDVTFTNLDRLRDSNPLYSGIWRVFFQWFGEGGEGWIPNPMAKDAPDVTFRSYLQLLNLKANHRKVFATEDTAIIASANPHDESGFHSNIAFQTNGNIIGDILESEQAVSDFSDGGKLPEYHSSSTYEKGEIEVQLVTEGKILKHLLKELKKSKKGDQIWIGIFYLAERKVIDEIDKAADRGAKVRIIMDPNKNAFGNQKSGLPNIPISAEMEKFGNENIEVKWYNTNQEQYHTKMIYFDRSEYGTILGGSANFTARNLDDFNLEADIKITAPADSKLISDVDSYFNRIWTNVGGTYTVPYKEEQNHLTPFKYLVYWVQKLFRFTSY